MLVALAEACDLPARRDAMFRGDRINTTENRAVLHTALRLPRDATLVVDGQDVWRMHAVLDRMTAFSQAVRSGGGPDTPANAFAMWSTSGSADPTWVRSWPTRPSKHYSDRDLTFRFVSNVDGTDFVEAVHDLDPEETLFVVSSKTFTTQETMNNAHAARRWLLTRCVTRRPSRSTSWRCPPMRRRWKSSASIPTTCLASGTGSVAATPWTRRSDYPRCWRSVPRISRTCSPASTRWTSISGLRPPARTSRR